MGIWLFGGFGFDSAGTNGELNDLWKYDPVANEWTWVSGSSTVPGAMLGQPGIYGTRGSPSPGNTPGGREIGAGWTDKTGNLWLFGGGGESDFFNDLWEYNPVTNEWTWMAGSSTAAGYGTYGNLGAPSVNNSPGGRVYSAGWTDQDGNLWLSGGNGFAGNGYGGLMDDLWEFLPASSEWVWMGGSSNGVVAGQPGVYGTIASSAAANLPGTRDFAAAWTDNHGVFWLFGGWGNDSANNFGYLNDLWNYQVAGTVPPVAAPGFSPAAGTYQLGQTVTLSDSANGASIYYTTDGKTVPTVNSTLYAGPIALTGSESIQAIAVATGSPVSYVAGATYSIPAATPTFGVPAGTYTSVQKVTITDATAGATIYYTTDGSPPTISSTAYKGAITVSQSETLSAIAVAAGFSSSNAVTAAYTINLPPPDFSVAASPASVTVNPGQASTATITITPSNGFNAAVTFACSGLPSGATCSFSPATVTPSTSPTSSTVTISTSLSSAVNKGNHPFAISPMVFSLVLGLFLWRSKKRGQILTLLLLAWGIGISLGGCGSGSSSATGLSGNSKPVTSNVTVTASAGSLQHITVLSLTVE